jgi:agmatine/peptidylarginine deiminase
MRERIKYFELIARDKPRFTIMVPTETGQPIELPYNKDELTAWARDWAPLGARTQSGELRLIDQNYYRYRPADDEVPWDLQQAIKGSERVSVPVYNEGGNFMLNTQGHCFMTERVVEANNVGEKIESGRPDSDPTTDRNLDKDQIAALYRKFMGCTQVTIFPRLPHEGTGHIDMWAKLMTDDTMMVANIEDEMLQLPAYSDEQRGKVRDMQQFLNDRAIEIKNIGFNVVRIPNPAPFFRDKNDEEPLYRSYTNSLLVNKIALVPRYEKPARKSLVRAGVQYPDHHLLEQLENQVGQLYARFGYEVRWETTDNMIDVGGSVHCGTMQLGR